MRLLSTLTLSIMLTSKYMSALPTDITSSKISVNATFGAAFRPQDQIAITVRNEGPFTKLPASATAHLLLHAIDRMWRAPHDAKPAELTDIMVNMKMTFTAALSQESFVTAYTMGWATIHLLDFFLVSSTASTYEFDVGTCFFAPPSGFSIAWATLGRVNNQIGGNKALNATGSGYRHIEDVQKRGGDESGVITVPSSTYLGLPGGVTFDIVYQLSHRLHSMSCLSMMDLAYQFLLVNVWPHRSTQTTFPLLPQGYQTVVGPNRWGDFLNIELTKSSVVYEGLIVFIDWGILSQALISVMSDPAQFNFGFGFQAPVRLRMAGSQEISEVFMQIVVATTRVDMVVDARAGNETTVTEVVAAE